ncbi:hypothetical protein [Cronobacter phage JC01]|uniref:Uncharacterized protein n=1 Tax=Cronobacter phage JC01 TaxID=2729575 RepID=A0A6M3YKG7_9CAUD|nr:hypothetical protein JT331_gp63 [Cronobacter phage JC01]QJI52283.1 hypothetical protein [Cronobacter phage JC01]
MEQKELMNLAVAVANKFDGVSPIKSIIAELNGGVAVRIKDLNPSLYDAVAARLNVLLNGTKVAGYAYNSTVAPQGRQPGSYAAFAAPYDKMAEDLKEVKYSPVQAAETDTSAAQFESLAGRDVIDTREKAQAEVERLQKQWDLLDENELLRALMDKMEERHGEEFNAFFEATVRQIMIGNGMTELRINTAEVLKTLVESRPMRITEVPGFLVYELVEDNDA